MRERWMAALVALAAAVLVAAVIAVHPAWTAPLDARPLLAFDGAKVPALLRSLAVLAALNLAAWAAGTPVHRLLGGVVASPLDALTRLALGLLVLADLVLGLAAVRQLRRGVLLVVLLWLAATGLVLLVRWWPGSAVARVPPRSPAVGLAAAAALLMGLAAVLGAHMPDYGWDAFTYHLALPERYLFENRIVVSPLFPHTAFPLTIEMLYTLVLAVDPGPAAKLLHAELGAMAAAAAAAMAARHSPRAGALAVIVLAADPLFNWEMGVAYTDLGATLFAVLALAALQERREGGGESSLRVAGVLAGACAATRYTAAAVPATLVLLLCLSRQPLRRRLRDAAVVAALTLLVMAPWLARNLVMTGNPAAPAAQRLFHEEGQEYFDAQAMEQQIAFVRLVGFGRGLDDLLALPVNLTVRARTNDYQAFGYRIGPLYVAGLLAALVLARARAAPALRGLPPAVLVLALAWFFTSQEPRYLMPALGLAAVAAAVGWDEILGACARAWGRGLGRLAWLVPAAALAHTQAATLARLPYLYGYALGELSVEGFRRQEPALVVADRLHGVLGAGDRLLAVYEPRGFFFRGLDYVFAHYFEVMQLVHRAGDADALAGELRRMGVTHVLVNVPNVARYRTVPVPGYGERELAGDLATLETMLRRHTVPLLAERGVVVRRMAGAGPSAGPPAEEGTWER